MLSKYLWYLRSTYLSSNWLLFLNTLVLPCFSLSAFYSLGGMDWSRDSLTKRGML